MSPSSLEVSSSMAISLRTPNTFRYSRLVVVKVLVVAVVVIEMAASVA